LKRKSAERLNNPGTGQLGEVIGEKHRTAPDKGDIMKRYRLLIIIVFLLSSFSVGDLEATAAVGLKIKNGATVDVNNSTVSLNCLDLIIEDGGTLNLGTGAINGTGELMNQGQLNYQNGTVSYGNCRKLLVRKNGDGTGTVTSSPVRIDCGGDCESSFTNGSSISLSAAHDAGSAFDGWSGEGCLGNGDCSITMNQGRSVTATFNVDSDGEGIGDNLETGGPNNGDGDGNGTLDVNEDNVATFKDIYGTWVTIVSAAGTRLKDITFQGNPSPGDAPPGVTFGCGFFGFTIEGITPGGSTIVTIILHSSINVLSYYRYGPTPGNTANHWYEFTYNGETGAQISRQDGKIHINLNFKDGSRGDDDLQADGKIVDQGGPATFGGPAGNTGCFISNLQE